MQMLVFALWPKNNPKFGIANLWPLGKKIAATWVANRGYSSSYRNSVFCFHAGKRGSGNKLGNDSDLVKSKQMLTL